MSIRPSPTRKNGGCPSRRRSGLPRTSRSTISSPKMRRQNISPMCRSRTFLSMIRGSRCGIPRSATISAASIGRAAPMSAGIAVLIDGVCRLLLALLAVLALASRVAVAEPRHGIAMHGEPELPANFTAFPWVNPEAPQGGIYREALTGTFDSTNPYIVRGKSAAGVRTYVFESLMARNRSEPFSLYGLLAETIDVSPDRRQVTFRLRHGARFSDGIAGTSADGRFALG